MWMCVRACMGKCAHLCVLHVHLHAYVFVHVCVWGGDGASVCVGGEGGEGRVWIRRGHAHVCRDVVLTRCVACVFGEGRGRGGAVCACACVCLT